MKIYYNIAYLYIYELGL